MTIDTTTIIGTTNPKIENKTFRTITTFLFYAVLVISIAAVAVRGGILYHEITTNLDAPRATAFANLGISLTAVGIYRITLLLVYAGSWIGIGILIFWQRSDERIGLATAFFFVLFGGTMTGISGDNLLYSAADYGTAAVFLQAFAGIAWLIFFPYWSIFPTGTFEPRWTLIFVLPWIPSTISRLLPLDSPMNWYNLPRWVQAAPAFGVMIGLVVAQVIRYRTIYTPAQRAQTRWILLSMLIIGSCELVLHQILVPLYDVTTQQEALQNDLIAPWAEVLMVGVPLAFIFAFLRYRLWDVDLAINRSIVYTIVGAILIAIVFVVVTAAQFLFGGNTNSIFAIVLSLAVCVLAWRPLQARVQHVIDLRLYGLRFDQNAVREAQKPAPITHPGALSGHKIGEYQITDLLGRGGMGEVYKGVGEGRVVAIKVLSSQMEVNAQLLTRFEREAQTGMALHHPHIARVYDFGTIDGMAYMVQEFVEGENLQEYLSHSGKVDLNTMVDILEDVGDALDTAHEQGFIHRDIKPSNIMLRPHKEGAPIDAVLMDFGITKVKNASESLTGTNLIGTIDYMAPEQIQVRKTIDGRADIYALGVVCYEMLTGSRPFEGGVAQVLFAHLSQPAPDPRDTDASFPRETAHALLKALKKDPDQRFSKASEFVAALREKGKGQPARV